MVHFTFTRIVGWQLLFGVWDPLHTHIHIHTRIHQRIGHDCHDWHKRLATASKSL